VTTFLCDFEARSEHANDRMSMCIGNTRYSACRVGRYSSGRALRLCQDDAQNGLRPGVLPTPVCHPESRPGSPPVAHTVGVSHRSEKFIRALSQVPGTPHAYFCSHLPQPAGRRHGRGATVTAVSGSRQPTGIAIRDQARASRNWRSRAAAERSATAQLPPTIGQTLRAG
jgi:hypothetical protein